MTGTHMEIHQITNRTREDGAGSPLHSVTNLECLKMKKTGLAKAMHHLGILGMSIDHLKPRESLGSQSVECESPSVALGEDACGNCPVTTVMLSPYFLSSCPSVRLRRVKPMNLRWWVTWGPSQAPEVKHVQPLVVPCEVTLSHSVRHRGLALGPLSRGRY